jgi:hypothetical protein
LDFTTSRILFLLKFIQAAGGKDLQKFRESTPVNANRLKTNHLFAPIRAGSQAKFVNHYDSLRE